MTAKEMKLRSRKSSELPIRERGTIRASDPYADQKEMQRFEERLSRIKMGALRALRYVRCLPSRNSGASIAEAAEKCSSTRSYDCCGAQFGTH